MKPGSKISSWDIILQSLGPIWMPGAKALQLQRNLGVQSLEDTAAAARTMGCEVCYVDLPNGVSGFAQVIEDKPHIVLNRAESCENLLYTFTLAS